MSLEAAGSRVNARRVRRHIVSHWRVWAALAVVVVVVNELIDRNFFDHREHVDGDVLVTVVVLLIAISVSYLVGRTRTRKLTAQ